MNWLGFGSSCQVSIAFDDATSRRTQEIRKKDGTTEKLFVFEGRDTVAGRVSIKLQPGKRIEHSAIRVELVGAIEMAYDRGNHYEFLALCRELSNAGEITFDQVFPFKFENVEKQYDSYNGTNVRLRYFLRFTIEVRRALSNIVKEQDLWVANTVEREPDTNNPIKMEVGIEHSLHIEFEYGKSKYHLKDCIVGNIFFLLVKLKIKHMELALIRKETTGAGPTLYNESETLTKFEIMDGAPVRGERIPVRLYLSGFDLTPTFRAVHNKFSVKYFLNLVLVDEDEKRYFKQHEITMYRAR
mmetsp:Transcript_7369/g.18602  ORF Transcript_7369/g.18602 Transcript_7369/m.18602 type:complete len:299 (-) Transcript_7369:110-1006(-)